MRRNLAKLLFLALLAGVSCATPTLPLPPPETPIVSPVSGGQVHLTSGAGGVEPGALVVILNDDATVPGDKRVGGAVAAQDGSWDAYVTAQTNDVLQVTQQSGDLTSPPVYVVVPQ